MVFLVFQVCWKLTRIGFRSRPVWLRPGNNVFAVFWTLGSPKPSEKLAFLVFQVCWEFTRAGFRSRPVRVLRPDGHGSRPQSLSKRPGKPRKPVCLPAFGLLNLQSPVKNVFSRISWFSKSVGWVQDPGFVRPRLGPYRWSAIRVGLVPPRLDRVWIKRFTQVFKRFP